VHVFPGQTLFCLLRPFGAPGQFRFVAHAVDPGQLGFAEDHQVVGQTQEVRLDGFGVG
jgi:hypothetical protein